MEVPPDILKKLLCSVCGEYLSCTPVRMKNDGAALCGRCCDPEGESTLCITAYEDLAEMFLFPCANKTHGCTETLYMAEMKDHEEECEYKQFVCPVTESGQCDWSGARKDILGHCQKQHPDKLLQNPGRITHQINETNRKTFLLTAFKMLFIVQCKVCIVTKSIYHCVRLVGKSMFSDNYKYVLIMLNKNNTLTMRRAVASQGCVDLQEDIPVQVDFNTMLKLGEFQDTIFKIKVGWECVDCKKREFKSLWPTDIGWCCTNCAPATRQCKFHSAGCSYTDSDEKTTIHEDFYCSHGTWCIICSEHVTAPRDQHYESAHADITYKAGTMWRAPIVNGVKTFIIASDVGKLWCDYVCNDPHKFTINIRSAMDTLQQTDYIWFIYLRNPNTGSIICEPIASYYDEMGELVLYMPHHDISKYIHDNQFDIKFEVIKRYNI